MRTIRAHIPTSGRLRTRSITLPMYMLAMTAQTKSGFWTKSIGPGWRPYIISPPRSTAIDGAVGSPKEKSGTNPAVEVALFAASGAADPLDRPVAEPLGMLGEPFLEIVGHKGRDRRGASGEEPQQETDRRGAEHRPPALFDIGPGRHPALDLHLADGGESAAPR